ncbi:hypothetical protein BV898_09911 [Hypsibius exemplaris]|uniref:Uncharacterized protein n=1 Tax=Hypsibius exemplaris TaxID=2072580 RepID=A0A1W0WL92_HYPEX|nr:hypothetical protein BV898_09911 [Hypsibius exemplaris]
MPMNGQYNLVMGCDYPPDVNEHFRRSGIDTHRPNIHDQAVMTAFNRIKQKDTEMASALSAEREGRALGPL